MSLSGGARRGRWSSAPSSFVTLSFFSEGESVIGLSSKPRGSGRSDRDEVVPKLLEPLWFFRAAAQGKVGKMRQNSVLKVIELTRQTRRFPRFSFNATDKKQRVLAFWIVFAFSATIRQPLNGEQHWINRPSESPSSSAHSGGASPPLITMTSTLMNLPERFESACDG